MPPTTSPWRSRRRSAPRLPLVVGGGGPPEGPAPRRARDVAELSPVLARHRTEVVRWALAEGRPAGVDALTVLLDVREVAARGSARAFTAWRVVDVEDALYDAHAWCSERGVPTPENVPETLWTYLTFLHQRGRLAPAAEPLALLREPLRTLGVLDRGGRSRRGLHGPAAATAEVVPLPDRRPARRAR